MSRSRRKQPYVATACHARGSMKKWKTQNNRVMRRKQLEEIPHGGYYKKLVERWSAPDDGRHYWDNPKAYRK